MVSLQDKHKFFAIPQSRPHPSLLQKLNSISHHSSKKGGLDSKKGSSDFFHKPQKISAYNQAQNRYYSTIMEGFSFELLNSVEKIGQNNDNHNDDVSKEEIGQNMDAEFIIHKVQGTDTLLGIAFYYQVKTEDIQQANNMTSYELSALKELKIPNPFRRKNITRVDSKLRKSFSDSLTLSPSERSEIISKWKIVKIMGLSPREQGNFLGNHKNNLKTSM